MDNGAIAEAGATLARTVWTRRIARLGFASKAVVYAVAATLAIGAAAGVVGFDPTDTRGALVHIGQGILGRGVVLALAVGFVGLATWYVVEAAWNPRPSSNAVFGAVSRVGQACGGIGYLAFAMWAAEFALFGGGAAASSSIVRRLTAEFLGTTSGAALVLVAAAIVVVVGVRQIRIGALRVFESWLVLQQMRPALRRWGGRLGTIGYCTQGTIFTLVGLSLAAAVVQQQASEAKGFDGVLSAIARVPYGQVPLAMAGLGLLAYAAFAVIEGKYKKMNPEPSREVTRAED